MDYTTEAYAASKIEYALGRASKPNHEFFGKLIIEMPWGSRAIPEFTEMFKQLKALGITEFYSTDESTSLLGQLRIIQTLGAAYETVVLDALPSWPGAILRKRLALHVILKED